MDYEYDSMDDVNTLDPDKITRQLNELLRLVQANLERLDSEMNTALAGTPKAKEAAAKRILTQVNALTKSVVELSKETRAWQKQSKEVGSKLTLAERIDLTVQFIGKLSVSDRQELLHRVGV